jgi:GNAT superfamily N-acetyltransferase
MQDEWMNRSGEQNRSAAIELIKSGEMTGYLAYSDGKIAGFCNANDKRKYVTLSGIKELADPAEIKCCSIVCYIMAPEYRRQGISRQLLKRVCLDYQALGYDFVEAYPRANAETCAQNYHGYLDLYLNEGFSLYQEYHNIKVVRRALKE